MATPVYLGRSSTHPITEGFKTSDAYPRNWDELAINSNAETIVGMGSAAVLTVRTEYNEPKVIGVQLWLLEGDTPVMAGNALLSLPSIADTVVIHQCVNLDSNRALIHYGYRTYEHSLMRDYGCCVVVERDGDQVTFGEVLSVFTPSFVIDENSPEPGYPYGYYPEIPESTAGGTNGEHWLVEDESTADLIGPDRVMLTAGIARFTWRQEEPDQFWYGRCIVRAQGSQLTIESPWKLGFHSIDYDAYLPWPQASARMAGTTTVAVLVEYEDQLQVFLVGENDLTKRFPLGVESYSGQRAVPTPFGARITVIDYDADPQSYRSWEVTESGVTETPPHPDPEWRLDDGGYFLSQDNEHGAPPDGGTVHVGHEFREPMRWNIGSHPRGGVHPVGLTTGVFPGPDGYPVLDSSIIGGDDALGDYDIYGRDVYTTYVRLREYSYVTGTVDLSLPPGATPVYDFITISGSTLHRHLNVRHLDIALDRMDNVVARATIQVSEAPNGLYVREFNIQLPVSKVGFGPHRVWLIPVVPPEQYYSVELYGFRFYASYYRLDQDPGIPWRQRVAVMTRDGMQVLEHPLETIVQSHWRAPYQVLPDGRAVLQAQDQDARQCAMFVYRVGVAPPSVLRVEVRGSRVDFV